MYNSTSLRQKAQSFALSKTPGLLGFHLISIQARDLHWPGPDDSRDGRQHDAFYGDFASPSRNADIDLLDRIIDSHVERGDVDSQQIYLIGWSNGGFFAQAYAIARHEATTPGGNRIAGVFAYTAGDPFEAVLVEGNLSCRFDVYPRSKVPIFIVSRACDAVACSDSQLERFLAEGRATPGMNVPRWVDALATRVENPNVTWKRVSGTGQEVSACTDAAFCSWELGFLNHIRWPDGVSDGSGIDYEPQALGFLKSH